MDMVIFENLIDMGNFCGHFFLFCFVFGYGETKLSECLWFL